MRQWMAVALVFLNLSSCYIDAPTCGDGRLDPGEACDGIYYASNQHYSCAQLGYNGTMLAGCTAGCAIDPTPCEATGRCGDGVITPGWEACDGADLGDQDCISLGHHGGQLACTADCRVDASGCSRCGDGIVQETAGELMESNVVSCLDDGYFGGFLYTEDCVHPVEEICGEFALIPSSSSVFAPVFAQAPDGAVLLAGRVSGSFEGYQNPGCPRQKELFETWYEDGNPYQQVVGTYHDPACAMEFAARRAPGEPERVTGQRPPVAPVEDLLALEDGGAARLCRGDPYYLLELVDSSGQVRVSSSLGLLGSGHLPRLSPLTASEAGISAVDQAGIHFARVDLRSGATTPLGFAADFLLDDQLHQFDVFQDHAASWVGPDEVFFVAALTPWESGQGGKKALFHGRPDPGGWTLTRLFGLEDLVPGSVRLFALQVSVAEDQVELGWVDDGGTAFHRGVWSLSGELRSHRIVELPGTHRVEALYRVADGTYALGGTTWLAQETTAAPNLCRASGASLMVLRVDADAGSLDARYFLTTAARPEAFDVDFCGFDRRSYDFDGATLLVGGTYDRAAGFCSDHEVATGTLPVPLHACGIFLVRLELPGAP